VGHVVHSSAFGVRNTDIIFGSAQCGSHKKQVETRYVKHVFLHLVGSAGHIVGSGASRVQNVDALFFMLM
jgi:hypothetical protein